MADDDGAQFECTACCTWLTYRVTAKSLGSIDVYFSFHSLVLLVSMAVLVVWLNAAYVNQHHTHSQHS